MMKLNRCVLFMASTLLFAHAAYAESENGNEEILLLGDIGSELTKAASPEDEVSLLKPTFLELSEDAEENEDNEEIEHSKQNPVVITYTIATQYRNGTYQSTFDWGSIQHGLSFIGRYKNVVYRRVSSGGRLMVIQANTQPIANAAAWTNGSKIYISPVFNFGRNTRLCKKVMLHENGHFIRGGTSHNSEPAGIMSPNGGTAGNLLPSDYPWFNKYPWISSLRPHHEPDRMRQEFSGEISPSDL